MEIHNKVIYKVTYYGKLMEQHSLTHLCVQQDCSYNHERL